MEEKKNQKLTYEQLNSACMQLSKQNEALIQRCKELEDFSMFKRLDYLFKVVECADTIKDVEFICYCVNEIKEAIIIPEPEKEA